MENVTLFLTTQLIYEYIILKSSNGAEKKIKAYLPTSSLRGPNPFSRGYSC